MIGVSSLGGVPKYELEDQRILQNQRDLVNISLLSKDGHEYCFDGELLILVTETKILDDHGYVIPQYNSEMWLNFVEAERCRTYAVELLNLLVLDMRRKDGHQHTLVTCTYLLGIWWTDLSMSTLQHGVTLGNSGWRKGNLMRVGD